MNIVISNIIFSITMTIVIYGVIYGSVYMVGKKDGHINQRYKLIESVLKGMTLLPLIILAIWFELTLVTGSVIKGEFEKDKNIAVWETQDINSIAYIKNGYVIDNKYRLEDINKVHITNDNKPYIAYVKRIQLGSVYYDTNSKLGLFKNVELYITTDMAERNMIYTSNNK